MYLRQAGLTRNPTFRIFNAFAVGDSAWLRKPRSNANTHVGCHARPPEKITPKIEFLPLGDSFPIS